MAAIRGTDWSVTHRAQYVACFRVNPAKGSGLNRWHTWKWRVGRKVRPQRRLPSFHYYLQACFHVTGISLQTSQCRLRFISANLCDLIQDKNSKQTRRPLLGGYGNWSSVMHTQYCKIIGNAKERISFSTKLKYCITFAVLYGPRQSDLGASFEFTTDNLKKLKQD